MVYSVKNFIPLQQLWQDDLLRQTLLRQAQGDPYLFILLASRSARLSMESHLAQLHPGSSADDAVARLMGKGFSPSQITTSFAQSWLLQDTVIYLPTTSLWRSAWSGALLAFVPIVFGWYWILTHMQLTPSSLGAFFTTTGALAIPTLLLASGIGRLWRRAFAGTPAQLHPQFARCAVKCARNYQPDQEYMPDVFTGFAQAPESITETVALHDAATKEQIMENHIINLKNQLAICYTARRVYAAKLLAELTGVYHTKE
ncbi:hypothetical protein Selin_0234 [Desulfurispirillum indicum S5]|uniref:Uncharacterized protein n=1 Tax=Desulfurispirillum indicum (strain ATCC BAA-1389 / DSM 22839 / S5) TaxID=653733 RepID=E6W652_DESIS|nr:hypothetical protein [Desulfurispirillum indicum]ADU64991.1 hypothetical protein Selin_0234 [Desulfurispirillum indicum S5]